MTILEEQLAQALQDIAQRDHTLNRFRIACAAQTKRLDELLAENEQLRSWRSGDVSTVKDSALTSLLEVISNSDATLRQRLKAASTVLGYRADDEAVTFTMRFLEWVCTNADTPADLKIEAAEQLRRQQAPAIRPAIERPSRTDDNVVDLAKAAEERRITFERRRAHVDALSAKIAKELGTKPGEGDQTA